MLRGCQPKAKPYDGLMRIHLFLLLPMLAVSLSAAEIDSGPKPGQAAPALKVKDLTGQHEGKVVDYLKARKKEPTVVVWLTDEGWGRPTARHLRAIDTHITKQNKGVYQVVVRVMEKQGKVLARFAEAQVNETSIGPVLQAIQKAVE